LARLRDGVSRRHSGHASRRETPGESRGTLPARLGLPRPATAALAKPAGDEYSHEIVMDLKIDVATRDVVLAVYDRMVVALFRGRTTVQAVRRSAQLVAELQASRQEPVLVLTVLEEHSIVPPLEVRVELVGYLKRVNGLVERSAVVFEGEGFRAATIRSIVAGVSLFSRPDYPHRVFASVGSAARFLANGRNGLLPPHRVIRMVQEVRRAPTTQTLMPWMQGPPPSGTFVQPR